MDSEPIPAAAEEAAETPDEEAVETPPAEAVETPAEDPTEAPERIPPAVPPVINIDDLDWTAIRAEVLSRRNGLPMESLVARLDAMLAAPPAMMFDQFRDDDADRAIHVTELSDASPLWIIGDLHGDLLALESAMAVIRRESQDDVRPRVIFLGDFFDDGGDGLAVLVRAIEIALTSPETTCIVIGNHEEALGHDGERFTATVNPSDFCDFLNARLDDDSLVALGKLAIRLFERCPRSLFLPDGLLVTHGGFPLTDLHAELRETGAWNDPRCLSDFTWTRAHPRARKKIPNRVSRGSQFGYEDFAAFCALTAELGRPVTHMVRGHDHVDERFEIYPAYADTPVLTTVALSRRLPRELMGEYARVPTVARWVQGALPQVHRLNVPSALVAELYPEMSEEGEPTQATPAVNTEGATE